VETLAKTADRLGFGHMWLPEAWGLETFSLTAHLLGATKKIELGSAVLNVYSRSAALIGMGCSTLNQICPNRFTLGLGSSAKALIENWHSVPFTEPLRRTKEYVDVIRRVVSGERVDYAGKKLCLNGFRLFTTPIKTKLKILLGALSDKNLSLAAQVGDGAIVTLYPMSQLDHAVDVLKNKAVNGESKELLAFYPLFTTDSVSNESLVKAQLKKYVCFYVASMGDYYARNLASLGYWKQVEKIRTLYQAGNRSEAVEAVDDELLSELTLVGSTSRVAETVLSLIRRVTPIFALNVKDEREKRDSINTLIRLAQALGEQT
jgi:alkanesulfonate monooxygenase SsuD/methylene tetrahydromethanopterin reductase-like flavin-dependent oxidoreductase (luciferase family)